MTMNLDIGELVLIVKLEFKEGEKLTLRWRGPLRISRNISEHLYEVEDISDGSVVIVHASRLRLYQKSKRGIKEELLAHSPHEEQGFEIEKLPT